MRSIKHGYCRVSMKIGRLYKRIPSVLTLVCCFAFATSWHGRLAFTLSVQSPSSRSRYWRQSGVAVKSVSDDASEQGDVSNWSARELKSFLNLHGISHADCFEKQELVARALSVKRQHKPKRGDHG